MSTRRLITACQRFGVYSAGDYRCFWCREPVKFHDCHIDHVIPASTSEHIEALRSQYGLPSTFEIDGFENWVPSCPRCNLTKRAVGLASSPSVLFHLQIVREQLAPKAKTIAEAYERDREVAPLLAKLSTAIERGQIGRSEIEKIASKAPPPSEEIRISIEWGIQQHDGANLVVYYSPLYTAEGRRQFRAERQEKIRQLSSDSARLDIEIANSHGEQREALSSQKTEIDKRLAQLKSGGLGLTRHLD